MASKTNVQPSIILYRGWADTACFVWSPFVTKLEARLRFAGLAYKTDAGSPRTAPKGKIPYVEITKPDSAPEMMADSSQIIVNLMEDGALPDLNRDLTPVERAYDVALRALLEEKLYFYQIYEKWHENYYTMRDHALGAIPWPMRILVGLMAYRTSMATLYGQGTARFSGEEIAAFRADIWENINELLVASKRKMVGSDNDKCFWVLGKESPSEADTVLFGFVVGAVISDAAPASRQVVKSFPIIQDYAARIRDRYFPDYASWE